MPGPIYKKNQTYRSLKATIIILIILYPIKEILKQQEQNEGSVPEEVKLQMQKLGFDLSESNDLYKVITNRFVKKGQFKYSRLKVDKVETNYDGQLLNKLPFWENYTNLAEEYEEYRKKTDPEFSAKPEHLIDFNAFGDFAAMRTGTKVLRQIWCSKYYDFSLSITCLSIEYVVFGLVNANISSSIELAAINPSKSSLVICTRY